jgi:dipeptidyl aminopeptidase/acylaminoacyl peptidase
VTRHRSIAAVLHLAALGAALLVAPAPLLSQAVAAADAPAANGTALRELSREDLREWRSIRNATISHDGSWFAYLLAPNEGDAQVVIRSVSGSREMRFPIGEPGAGAGVTISEDGRHAAFLMFPDAEAQKKLKRQKRPVQANAMVVELATGTTRTFEQVRRFAFSGKRGGHLALLGYAPEGERAVQSAPLRIADLSSGTTLSIAGVADFAFDDRGDFLAWTVELPSRVGNGVHVRDMSSGVVRSMDGTERALYRRLAWADTGRALTLLRGVVDSAAKDTSWAVLAMRDARSGTPSVLTAGGRSDMDASLRVSPARTPAWTSDRSAVTFGVREVYVAADSTDDELADLVIWHGREPRLQSMQQVQANRDRDFTWLAAWHPSSDRVVRLSDEELRDVRVLDGGRWAIGSDQRAYELDGNLSGRRLRDLWAVDVRSGERRQLAKGLRWGDIPSPDGTRLLFWNDGDWVVMDIATGERRNITQGLPVSFVNDEDDHNVESPPRNAFGWSSDGRSVMLSDGWDVWMVPVSSGRAVNLTVDGRENGTRYQRRLFAHPDERGIPVNSTLYFASYGERTKQEGVVRVDPRRPGAQSLMREDARIQPMKARDANVVVFSRQTAVEFPDWHATTLAFQEPRRITNANPQQAQIAWSAGARLVDYVTDRGDSLQGALFLPANYTEGSSYPTIVYIYEKLSQNLHAYSVPNETRALNPSVYTAAGYVVFMPDITYELNDPGMSAVWSVIPAVKAAIATGVVDSSRVALHGHSWGGYQTAFLVTQTNMFKAAIAGAPLTDMVSMYSSVYWNTGSANQPIFESSQGRFLGNYIANADAYIRNSPNRFADRVNTPLIILHNDKDGAVDFNQGITFYNTLRQLGKDVILLQYTGENHGLAKPANQKDYAIRMREFFDHHLRGVPMPEWLEHGVPHLEMKDHLRRRAAEQKAAGRVMD